MLIGGASGSTAGGMKVGTAAILLLAALQALRGKRYCSVFVANDHAGAVEIKRDGNGGVHGWCGVFWRDGAYNYGRRAIFGRSL